MQPLIVDPQGLTAFAASCTQQASQLRGALTDGDGAGPAFQATTAAVQLSDTLIDLASVALAGRVEELSTRLTAAATAYRTNDRLER
jgi:hypothetical protein